MKDLLNLLKMQGQVEIFDAIRIGLRFAGQDPLVVVRRGEKARDHQLPHL